MTQPHETHDTHEPHRHEVRHPSAVHPDASAPPSTPPAPDTKTLYSPDGQYKVVLRAWKDYWFFYTSIGAEVDVYRRNETRDTWGNKTVDWVKYPASIAMVLRYTGSMYPVPVPTGPSEPPPAGGGLRTIEIPLQTFGAHCEHRLWATGFFTTSISVNADGFGGSTHPAASKLDVDRVDAAITVSVGNAQLSDTVSASSYVHDNSAW